MPGRTFTDEEKKQHNALLDLAQGLIDQQRLWLEGKYDCKENDDVCDKMDKPWHDMGPRLQIYSRQLAALFNKIHDGK